MKRIRLNRFRGVKWDRRNRILIIGWWVIRF